MFGKKYQLQKRLFLPVAVGLQVNRRYLPYSLSAVNPPAASLSKQLSTVDRFYGLISFNVLQTAEYYHSNKIVTWHNIMMYPSHATN